MANKGTKHRIHEIIFEADTAGGKLFDVILLVAIMASIVIVSLDSIVSFHNKYEGLLLNLEWGLTFFFTIEYFLRLYSTGNAKKYAISFFGIIDLLAILPTYLSLFFVGTHTLVVIRALRILRVFRIFKLMGFLKQGRIILVAMRDSWQKIFVFFLFVILMVTILGSIMYLVEGNINKGFDNIPKSIYWAIVTLTTVGYGDITPITPLGRVIAAFIMILGYAVIAVPTGIVTAGVIKEFKEENTQVCTNCSREGHDVDARFCKFCGYEL